MHIYVDFIPIVSTSSPDDGLALLLAMYSIFELNFNKNSRTIRLLYCIAFSDKRFLTNTIRRFMKDKCIDINDEQNRTTTTTTNGNLNINTSSQTQATQATPQTQIQHLSPVTPTNMISSLVQNELDGEKTDLPNE